MSVLAVAAAVSVMAGAAVQSAVGFGFALVAWSRRGALAGFAVLRALDALALQLLVTAGVLGALAVNLRARPHAQVPPRAWWARPAAGVAAGALNTSTSTGGP